MGTHTLLHRERLDGAKSGFNGLGDMGQAPIFSVLSSEPAGGVESESNPGRDQLLLEHLPTVRYMARRIHERLPQHVELDDLISAGVVGLIDAFSKFDHAKKVQFKSYAQFRIRGAILDSLRTLDWSPRELRRKGRAVEEAIRSVTQRAGTGAGGAGDCAGDGVEPGRVSATAGRAEGAGDRQPAHGADGGLGRRGAGVHSGFAG